MTAPRSTPAEVVRSYWAAVDAHDWPASAALLAAEVEYLLPQTGERVRGRDALVRFNAEYPGDWRLRVATLVADGPTVMTTIEFVSAGIADQTGISRFDVVDGAIVAITEWWPEPYEPPAERAHLVELD